jgi:iron complex outermembrane receptor protein
MRVIQTAAGALDPADSICCGRNDSFATRSFSGDKKMRTFTIKKCFAGLVASIGGFVLGNAAIAQDTQPERALEEIIVTAQYREAGLQDVPISVSAVTGQTLTETALQKAEDIQFLVPNFNMTETGISTSVFIRGIGSGINQGFEQSVGYYIDGVHYPRGQQSRMPFLDLERIEVLRGPQSILFGKNSVAGALNVTTARPTEGFEGSIFASAETEDGETIVEGMLSGPFSDNVRARIAARTRDSDGYIFNATVGRDEPQREDWTVRGTVEFDIGDSLTATLKAEISEFDVRGRHVESINVTPAEAGPFAGLDWGQILTLVFGQDSSVLNNTRDGIRHANDDFSFNDLETYVLTLDWDFGEYELKSISAWETFEYDEVCDCDFTGANIFGAALQEEYDQFSQEFRLTSPLNEKFDYIAGLYYQTSDHEYHDQIFVDPDSMLIPAINALTMSTAGNLLAATEANRLATVDNDVISAFAQFNWHISDVITLQLGGRYTQDDRDGFRTLSILAQGGSPLPAAQAPAALLWGDPGLFAITSTNLAAFGPTGQALIDILGELPVSGTRDKNKFSPDAKLVWDVSDDIMLYGSWAQGFKSGSFDFRANNKNFYADMPTSFEFEDEEATNWELGGKFGIGGRAEINATVFFTDYEDLQVSLFDGRLGFNVGNAAEAEIVGAEFDVRIAAGDYLTISGGLAYLDFEFTDFRNGQCYFGQTPTEDLNGDGTPDTCPYTGQPNQMVSDWQGNVTFDFDYPIASNLVFTALLDIFYKGDHHTSNTFDPKLIQDAYTKVNARFGIGSESGSWEIAVLGRNLTDEEVLQYGGDLPLSGSVFGAGGNYAFFAQGRTLSVQGTLRF